MNAMREDFDLEKAIVLSKKLRGKYNRSGLSNTDYNKLLQLEKSIEQALPEEILNQRPEGATHWQAGVYYRVSKYGVWAKWDKSWITSFKWPDGVMTPLEVSEKS
ncbi:hypothetical protein [Acinetobacter calcoaceticus]|uniref:hypothetical protein n=1 Tax=Acinetobacter calcoaceticus TaxID=471 RepID=UPI00148F01F7|nr:hypothetical protein [Acinetobacter calcoaceticus]